MFRGESENRQIIDSSHTVLHTSICEYKLLTNHIQSFNLTKSTEIFKNIVFDVKNENTF